MGNPPIEYPMAYPAEGRLRCNAANRIMLRMLVLLFELGTDQYTLG